MKGLGIDFRKMHVMLTRLMQAEHQDAAYWLRQEGKYREAYEQYRLSMSRSKINPIALVGILKLLPHWVVRGRKHGIKATESRKVTVAEGATLQPATVKAGARE